MHLLYDPILPNPWQLPPYFQIDIEDVQPEVAFKKYHVMIKIVYEGVVQALQSNSFDLIWNTLVCSILKVVAKRNMSAMFIIYFKLNP